MRPPRLAGWLLLLLPRALGEPIAGDLEEEWHAAASPSRARYWSLVLRSIAACWIATLRAGRRRPARHNPAPPGDSAMQSLMQDLRYGCRLLWRSPGFTLAAVATLALGIGANTAIFSIVNVLSLKPLPYHEPGRVAFVLGWDVDEGEMRFNLRRADYLDLQRQATGLESVAAYNYLSANLTGGDVPERVQAYRVTPNTFSMLGVPAAMGRVFDEAGTEAGRPDVAVISHGLWQRLFGGAPTAIGRTVVLNGETYQIVGVMPQRFEFPVFNFKGDIWVPWQIRDADRGQPGASGGATVVGRLRPDVTYAQAQAEIDVLMGGWAQTYPDTNRSLGARVVAMGKLNDQQMGDAVPIVLVTVALVLLLACANVANLLLSRGAARQRELAVRAAIGASRFRIGRQLLVESTLLAVAGGAVAIGISSLTLQALKASLPEMLLMTVPNVQELGVDGSVLAYTLVLTLAASVVFGLLPAWRASSDKFQGGLKESASTGGSRGTRRLRTGLVVAEVALSTTLLVGAGLLARSYAEMAHVSPGFEPAGVLTMAMTLPERAYGEPRQRSQFYEQAIERIQQLAGVQSAAMVNVLPFSTYDDNAELSFEGQPAPEPGREPSAGYRVASPGYFETLRIPITQGRRFDDRDAADGAPVAIVNQALAARFFSAGSPVGRRVRFNAGPEGPWLTIVGVVGTVRHSSLTEAPRPEIYLPMAQAPRPMMMLAVRTATRPEDLIAAVRAEVSAVDPAQPVYHVKTLERMVDDSMLPQSTSAGMMMLMGALALVLAAIGVYGVVAYGVSQQTREFGVRLALGATPRDLLRLVFRSGILMVGAGVVLGLAGALGLSRLMAGALHGVSASDPLTYLGVASVLTVTGLVACGIPAWRASTTQPLSALRSD